MSDDIAPSPTPTDHPSDGDDTLEFDPFGDLMDPMRADIGEFDQYRPAVGTDVMWRGERYRIAAFDGATVMLRQQQSNQLVTVAIDEFFVESHEAKIQIVDAIDIAPKQEQARAYALMGHILDVETGRAVDPYDNNPAYDVRYDPELTTVPQRFATKLTELPKRKVGGESLAMSRSQLFELRKRYREAEAVRAGAGLSALVREQKVAIRECGLDDRVVKAITDLLKSNVLGPRYTYTEFYWRLGKEVGDTVELPSESALREYLDRTPEGTYTFKGHTRTKRTNAEMQVRVANMERPVWSGDRVEFDGTRMNNMIVHEDGTFSRSFMSAAVDVAPLSLVAARLSKAERGVDCALLLFDMVTPARFVPGTDERLRMDVLQLGLEEHFVNLRPLLESAAARPIVVPKLAVVDNGKAWVGNTFKRACAVLGIVLLLARLRRAADKPNIERANDSLDDQVFRYLPWYVGGDLDERGDDEELKKRAKNTAWKPLTMLEAQAALDLALIGWQFEPSEGLRDPFNTKLIYNPMRRWVDLSAGSGIVPRPVDPDLMYRLLPTTMRAVTAKGVQIDYRFYWDPSLPDDVVRRLRAGSGLPHGPKLWPVREDPRNINYCFLHDVQTGKHYPLRWKQADIVGQPLADVLWRAARAAVHRAGADDKDERIVALKCRDLLWEAGYVDGAVRQALRDNANDTAASLSDHTTGGIGVPDDRYRDADIYAFPSPEDDIPEFDEDDAFVPSEYDPLEDLG